MMKSQQRRKSIVLNILSLKNDGALWRRFFNGLLARMEGWFDVENAAPPIRYLYLCFIPLYYKKGRHLLPIGSFIPELYHLADMPRGDLRCQRENKTKKSAIELAIVPSMHEKDIVRRVKAEYYYRRDKGLALPVPVSKMRIIPDYLASLPIISNIEDYPDYEGVVLKASKGPQGIYINLKNEARKATRQEKILHFVGVWLAWLVTLSASIIITESLWASALVMALLYLAKITGNEYDLFDKAENLHRDLGWLLFLSWKTKNGFRFSLINTLKTLVKLTALSVASYFAVIFTWGALIPILPSALSAFFAILAGVFTFLGGSATQRFYWNLSFCDNQITIDRKMGKRLSNAYQACHRKPVFAPRIEKLRPTMLVQHFFKVADNRLRIVTAREDSHHFSLRINK